MSPTDPPTAKRKVLIVDDHPIMRTGLAQLINVESDLEVCGDAEDAHGALDAVQRTRPDIVIVDISLKDSSGIELIKDIRIRHPKLPVLVLSMHDESFYAERVLRAGAHGYVTKSQAPTRVVEGIRRVLDGGVYVSETLTAKMLHKIVGGAEAGGGLLLDRLSDREFEVFEMIGKGRNKHEIAGKLHLSAKTIDAHRENIKKKLKISNAIDLLKYAIQWVEFGGTR